MPRSINTGLSLRITGAENVRGSITQWRATTKDRILLVLERNAPYAVQMMRDAMFAAYPWGGKTAASLDHEITEGVTGPSVRISVNAYREVKYLTSLLPESDFRSGPYPITANGGFLQFYWRRPIPEMGTPRWVNLRKVMHPGFPQGDVLRQSGEQALGWLGVSVEQEVRSAVAELQSGGKIYSLSRRR